MSSSTPRPLVGRSAFAGAVAATTPLLAMLAEEAIADHKRGDPRWTKFGHKAIDIIKDWQAAESKERRLKENANASNDERTGGPNDPDSAKRVAGRKVRRDVVEKVPKGKKKGSGGLRWGHITHKKGCGSPLKKGVPMPALDEDDEEELPAVRVKEEDVVKVEADHEVVVKAELDT